MAVSQMPNGPQALNLAYEKLDRGENVDLIALERALRRSRKSRLPKQLILSKSIEQGQSKERRHSRRQEEQEHVAENTRMIVSGEIQHPDKIIPLGYTSNFCPLDENPEDFRRRQRREYARAVNPSIHPVDKWNAIRNRSGDIR